MSNTQTTGMCRGCLQFKALVKSHIIPKSLHALIKDKGSIPWLYKVGSRPKQSFTGIHERILCDDCEKRFQLWDNYAAQFFRDILPATSIMPYNPNDVFYAKVMGKISSDMVPVGRQVVQSYDYTKLKLFFISLVWRASLAEHEFYSAVDLGVKHDACIRGMMQQGDAGGPDDYAAYLQTFDDQDETRISYPPRRVAFGGVKGYNFLMAKCSVFIKMDSRPMPRPYSSYTLKPNGPLIIPVGNWQTSRERKLVLKGVANIEGIE